MHVGAAAYLTKPVDLYELRKRVTTHLEKRQLQDKVLRQRARRWCLEPASQCLRQLNPP